MIKTNQKSAILIAFGLLIVATSQIGLHFTTVSDFAYGLGMGAGFGLVLTGLWKLRKDRARNKMNS